MDNQGKEKLVLKRGLDQAQKVGRNVLPLKSLGLHSGTLHEFLINVDDSLIQAPPLWYVQQR